MNTGTTMSERDRVRGDMAMRGIHQAVAALQRLPITSDEVEGAVFRLTPLALDALDSRQITAQDVEQIFDIIDAVVGARRALEQWSTDHS